MNLSTWAIRHPVPPLAAFLVLCICGIMAFRQLPVNLFPNIDFPVITVDIGQPGAAPAELINQVTKPVEDALSNITGVEHIASTASESHSQTMVQFGLDTDPDRALNQVKDAMARIREDLPDSVGEPYIHKLDVNGGEIMHYAVTDSSQSAEALSFFVDDVIARQLKTLKGVGQVVRQGGVQRQIKVELNPARLLALSITASDVSSQLSATLVNTGGGRGQLAGQELSIRALGNVDSIEQLSQLPLATADGRTIRLAELGDVIDGAAERRMFALLNGEPVISVGILRSVGASEVSVSQAVHKKVAQLRLQYPDISLELISDSSTNISGNYRASMATLYEGAILAVIVVMVFLRNWRATLITATALPLSIVPTYFVMHFLGFSLNTVSLLGITLVTGILVDDAIVEIENIIRHIGQGKSAYSAAQEAASEIGLTVVAISLTIVAVFAPVSFMSGIMGQYFKQFGLTVAIAVLFSLLVARLITPMLAAWVLKDSQKAEVITDGLIMRGYLRVLRWTLANRLVTLVVGLLLFAASIFSATLLPADFVPASDDGMSTLSVELPPGATIDDTLEVSYLISKRILSLSEVNNVHVVGGTDDIVKASIVVNYAPKESRTRDSFELEDNIRTLLADVPDAKIQVNGASGERDIIVNVLADSTNAMAVAAEQLAAEMQLLPELAGVSTSALLARPEIRITPKPELAAELGVTASSLAATVRVATIGDSYSNLAKFNTGDRQLPIVVRLREDVRRNLQLLSDTRIPSTRGSAIPLGVVADVSVAQGPSAIERYDRQMRTSVQADLADGVVLGPAMDAIFATKAASNMPEGTRIQRDGDAEVMGKMFESFGLAMGLGLLLVYVVLVVLFDSFVTPLTILLSLPLCIGGAIFALFLSGNALSLSVIIGFLMLMGIVTKNAIMLVDFALQGIKSGLDRDEAVLEAGHNRARPIVMTTIAMVAGMVPSALAVGTGGEFRSPMAIAVIGGLLLSTVLSLVFVPSLFSVINGLKSRLRKRLVSILGNNQSTSQTADQPGSQRYQNA